LTNLFCAVTLPSRSPTGAKKQIPRVKTRGETQGAAMRRKMLRENAKVLGAATIIFRRLAPALPKKAPLVIVPQDEAAFLSAAEGKVDGPLTGREDFRWRNEY
jgi:hypothetical protein